MAIRKIYIRPNDLIDIHLVYPEVNPLNATGFKDQCTSRQQTILIGVKRTDEINILSPAVRVNGGLRSESIETSAKKDKP